MNRVRKKLAIWTAGLLVAGLFGGGVMGVASPAVVQAKGCEANLLTFPPWYKGLTNKDCSLKSPGEVSGGLQSYVLTIAFNLLDILLQLAAYIAFGFVMYAGFKYLTQSSSPDGMAKARKTLQNALIGLVIAMAAVAAVKLVSGAIAG